MKHTFRISLLLVLSAFAAACSDDDDPVAGISINGGESFLSLDALARSGEITVDAPAPWSVQLSSGSYGASEKPDWITLTAETGGEGITKIGVTFTANSGPARSAVLLFACAGRTSVFTLSQAAATADSAAPQYYFYVAFGTLPALYSGLHLLSHDRPSYFFYERAKTFDPAQFPAYATPLTDTQGNGTISVEETIRIAEKLKSRILEINAEDPTAVFGFYVNELTCRLGYDWFVAQGIDPARVQVTLLSDGTATYDNFFNYFGDPATAEQQWNTYAGEVEALDWNHGGRYPETRAPAEYLTPTWTYYLATRPDYRLMVQNRELLESSGPFITAQLNKMHIESVQPYEMLDALPEAAKQQFYRMAGFDYDAFGQLFDRSPKKNLIIIGTSHTTPASEQQQAAYVSRIVEQYGAQYDIFFKPHPADTSSANYAEQFPGLTLLPGQMPFEIFVWSLLDKVDLIGGYPSTVFLSVPLDKVGFLFAADAASLIHPLNILFRDASTIEWIP